MSREVFKLFCCLRDKGAKLVSIKSHMEFIENCCESNLITKGLSYRSKVAFQNQELRNFAQETLDRASLSIQERSIVCLKEELKIIQRDFQRGKAELFRNVSFTQGCLLVNKLKLEMDRLCINNKHEKDIKMKNLRKYSQREQWNWVETRRTEFMDRLRECQRNRHKRKQNRRKRRKCKERKRVKKRGQRKRSDEKETEKWKEILREGRETEKSLEDRKPMDRTDVNWTPGQLRLLSKGQKFVPAPKKIDRVKKFDDFMAFARKLRLAIYFYEKAKWDQEEGGKGEKREETGAISEKMPWEKPSEFNPAPGQSEALEDFLNKVMAYLFDPKNKRKFVDNLTHGEREALRDLSTWNKDEKNPRVIRVQDKGSCFVVDFKAKYVENNLQYVSDPKTFSSDDVDNSISNLQNGNGQENGRGKVFLGCRNAIG